MLHLRPFHGALVVAIAALASPVLAAPSGAESGSAESSPEVYAVRIRDLEARIKELEERVRTLAQVRAMPAEALPKLSFVDFHNHTSTAFRLVKAVFVLDGACQYTRADDTGSLASPSTISVFHGVMAPGPHVMQADLTFRANGYGILTYLEGYEFHLTSSHSFTVVDGEPFAMAASAFDTGNAWTPLAERLELRWNDSSVPTGP